MRVSANKSRLVPVVAAMTLTWSLVSCSGVDKATDAPADPETSTEAGADTVTCDYPASGAAAKEVAAPPTEVAAGSTTPVVVSTTFGDLVIDLTAGRTPCTVNSFVSLASQGYFDDVACHRLTTQGIFVLQCGDPTGTGAGGPGYSFADELDQTETYPAGTVAMANAGPNTNGSQFFLVYADTELPPSYTVFGTLDAASTKAVKKLAKKGTADGGPDGAPLAEATITSVTTP